MCGRACCSLDPECLMKQIDCRIQTWVDQQYYQPSYNISPGTYLPVLRQGMDKSLELQSMKWGLIPFFWNKDEAPNHFRMFNARLETLEEKQVFRNIARRRRGLVSIEGFFEWTSNKMPASFPPSTPSPMQSHSSKRSRTPYFVTRPGHPLLKLAVLYDVFTKRSGEEITSFAVITTEAGPYMSWTNDRMPIILSDEGLEKLWLQSDFYPMHGQKRSDFKAERGNGVDPDPHPDPSVNLDLKIAPPSPNGARANPDAAFLNLLKKMSATAQQLPLSFHPVTSEVGRLNFHGPECIEDVSSSSLFSSRAGGRPAKGTKSIQSFFGKVASKGKEGEGEGGRGGRREGEGGEQDENEGNEEERKGNVQFEKKEHGEENGGSEIVNTTDFKGKQSAMDSVPGTTSNRRTLRTFLPPSSPSPPSSPPSRSPSQWGFETARQLVSRLPPLDPKDSLDLEEKGSKLDPKPRVQDVEDFTVDPFLTEGIRQKGDGSTRKERLSTPPVMRAKKKQMTSIKDFVSYDISHNSPNSSTRDHCVNRTPTASSSGVKSKRILTHESPKTGFKNQKCFIEKWIQLGQNASKNGRRKNNSGENDSGTRNSNITVNKLWNTDLKGLKSESPSQGMMMTSDGKRKEDALSGFDSYEARGKGDKGRKDTKDNSNDSSNDVIIILSKDEGIINKNGPSRWPRRKRDDSSSEEGDLEMVEIVREKGK